MTTYNDYNSYLKNRFGCKVYKIGIDAGFSCPNRDGTKGTLGCIYCNSNGSRASYANPKDSVRAQLENRIEFLKKSYGAEKFIAYFQAFTNTYAPVDKLKAVYDDALRFSEVVGMSIGTRPDSVDKEKLSLISSYRQKMDVCIEYGLQSIHDKTLNLINRGHVFSDFVNAYQLTKSYGIFVCVHIILGLPGETHQDMIETAKALSALKVDAVKIHLLHVLRGSRIEEDYKQNKIRLLSQEEYVTLACDFLENLSSDIVIERLTGEGARLQHVAPIWALDKTRTIDRIKKMLKERGSHQGIKYD